MDKFLNFMRYGIFASDDFLDINRGKKSEKVVNREKIDFEEGDFKAILIAAVQVFGPIIAGMILIGLLMLYITANYF